MLLLLSSHRENTVADPFKIPLCISFKSIINETNLKGISGGFSSSEHSKITPVLSCSTKKVTDKRYQYPHDLSLHYLKGKFSTRYEISFEVILSSECISVKPVFNELMCNMTSTLKMQQGSV